MKRQAGLGAPTVWLTGIPASGKTTLARLLMEHCHKRGILADILDGDEMRLTLSRDLGFTREARLEHAKRVIYVAKLLARNRIVVIIPLISPYRETRQFARDELENFVEVYVKAPLETCIKRDPKGLYKKAMAGEIKDLTGLQAPYEEPLHPEIQIETDKESEQESLQKLVSGLQGLGYLK